MNQPVHGPSYGAFAPKSDHEDRRDSRTHDPAMHRPGDPPIDFLLQPALVGHDRVQLLGSPVVHLELPDPTYGPIEDLTPSSHEPAVLHSVHDLRTTAFNAFLDPPRSPIEPRLSLTEAALSTLSDLTRPTNQSILSKPDQRLLVALPDLGTKIVGSLLQLVLNFLR